ncbi:hypothetical protein [Stigmatella aurantiaca]|uniref:Conserved uncharacterized protein n=1 Tax=Stigmatella aurantiaca (strain DW4/3-1) TaxID=378806 RepID=Q09BV9_STIAD|nr:hypothetical protein [Stigmatella aurantiaca]ADO73934.1 conserved uncharacterized protein [Stigmatella aurantiaca DW4/3-1]EAU69183.1 hypothetical protein STIAU_6200 [Stigmatella aurantiaca DW4/3-1]
MGILKFLVWTACAVGLGIFLAQGQIDGRTPLDHMDRAWKRTTHPSQMDRMKNGVERVKGGLEEALEDAQEAVGKKTPSAPRERITAEDREAVNRIIAQKK